MINRILLIVVFVLSLISFTISSSSKTTFFNSEPNIKVKDTSNDKIESLNLEDYIIGVVAAEMPASFHEEALKAQAVAARTYAVHKMKESDNDFDVVTDVSNQGYIDINKMKNKWGDSFNKYYEKIEKAVNDTKGQVMLYGGNVIEAYYFAMSNGYTESSELVFSENLDYIESVESSYDNESVKNFIVTNNIKKEDFCKRLEITCEYLNIGEIERSNTNRVNYITINNNKIKGTTFRNKLNLRSTDFTIKVINDSLEITTKGYGHGVGMSQYGANGMAKDGVKYKDILKHFYKNIEISTI